MGTSLPRCVPPTSVNLPPHRTAGPGVGLPVSLEPPNSGEAVENRPADREDAPEPPPENQSGDTDQTPWDVPLDVNLDLPVETANDTGPAELDCPQDPPTGHDQPDTPQNVLSEPATPGLHNTDRPDEMSQEGTKGGNSPSIDAPGLSQDAGQHQQTPPTGPSDHSLRATPPPVGAGRPTRQHKLPARFNDHNLFGIRADNCWPAISMNRNLNNRDNTQVSDGSSHLAQPVAPPTLQCSNDQACLCKQCWPALMHQSSASHHASQSILQ